MRLQLNLLVERNPGISYVMSSLPRLLLPVMWFSTEAELPDTMAGSLALLVNMPVIMKACGLAGILLGLTGMVAMLACLVRLRTEPSADKPELALSSADSEYAKVLLKSDADRGEQGTASPLSGQEDLLLA
jgi:hypothetical protein